MNALSKTPEELKLKIPPSPQEFGRWVQRAPKPLAYLATSEDVKPWQLAFFAGWESFMRQTQHLSERVRFHPRGVLSGMKPLSQEESSPRSPEMGTPTSMAAPSAERDASGRRGQLVMAILALIGCALLIGVILFASH